MNYVLLHEVEGNRKVAGEYIFKVLAEWMILSKGIKVFQAVTNQYSENYRSSAVNIISGADQVNFIQRKYNFKFFTKRKPKCLLTANRDVTQYSPKFR